MVTTRSQWRKSASAQAHEGRRSSGSSSASSTPAKRSKPALAHTASPSTTAAAPSARKSVVMVDVDTPPRAARVSASLRLLEVPGVAPGEQLGRGCRRQREVVTLDEQYLQQSLHPTHATHGTGVHGGGDHGRRGGLGESPDKFIIHHRYPERDAAKRALSNLQDTLHEMERTGHTSSEDDEETDDGTDSSSTSSSNAPARLDDAGFRFCHHPELNDPRHRERKRHRSSASSSSSSCSDAGDDRVGARTRDNTNHQASSSTRRGRTSGTSIESGEGGASKGRSTGQKRVRASGSLTDASISDDSVREESIENLAQKDAKIAHDEDGTDDGVSDEDTMVTQSELRRAARNAKESVEKNININYYMGDAVGSLVPDKKQRKRELDRRYRHLFEATHNEEDGLLGSGSGGSGVGRGGGSGDAGDASATAAGALGDISPLHIDDGISFESVGGLPEHIVTLREMVLLPLLYPDLLRQLNLKPPRGVLFVGPPGTGKTLMARALANEGSRFTGQKITFFMRKGADILSKWVGESERQLKLLFEEAKRQQPSIIFFDEIDGLAPTRHTKTEQTQAALVATLLALLDGMEDRGQVVVIGATNRPDTLDPALRRPGRFDRELLFPSPDAAARRHILGILTQTLLPPHHPRRDEILTSLVAHTEGYSGADLKAVCTEAGLNRLRSAFPQLYTTSKRVRLPLAQAHGNNHDSVVAAAAATEASGNGKGTWGALEVRREDFFSAVQRVQPSFRRGGAEVRSLASLEDHQEVLYRDLRDALLQEMAQVWPTAARALRREQRDCTNLVDAVRELSAFPVPYPRGPLLVFLTSEVSTNAEHSSTGAPILHSETQATLLHASLALLKGLPSFQPLIVHLPHIQVSFLELPFGASSSSGSCGSAGLFSDVFASGHMYELIQVAQRSSPCAVVLRGAAEWLHVHGLPTGAVCAREKVDEDEETTAESTGTPRAKRGNKSHTDNPIDAPSRSEAAGAIVFDAETYERRLGNMKALHYYLNLLAETEVLIVVPCEEPHTRDALLGVPGASSHIASASPSTTPRSTPRTSAASSASSSLSPEKAKPKKGAAVPQHPQALGAANARAVSHALHPRFALLDVLVPLRPSSHAVEQFVQHTYHIVSLSLVVALRACRAAISATATGEEGAHGGETSAGAVEDDNTPMPALPLSKAQQQAARQRELGLWRRVEYRRLQLRHVLLKWVSQYVTAGRYKLLLSPDLDLTPSHELYKPWLRHTKGRRIGLQDVVEKLENESYTCLSQYHDDIDLITRNVRTFFTSRSAQDQRYRLKALELKETTVLSLYRINRGVIRFCEIYKDLQEPTFSSQPESLTAGEADGHGSGSGLGGEGSARQSQRDPLSFSQRPAATRLKRPPPRYFGQRRRRRRRAVKPITVTAHASDKDADGTSESAHTERAESEVSDVGEKAADATAENSPFSPTQAPAETLVRWAAAQLKDAPFHVLFEVFRRMMMSLEVQIEVLQHPLKGRESDQRVSLGTEGGTTRGGDESHSTPARPSRPSSVRGEEMTRDTTLGHFTPLAPPGTCEYDDKKEDSPTTGHASPSARDPGHVSTPSSRTRQKSRSDDPTPTSARASSASSRPLMASQTPSSHEKTPLTKLTTTTTAMATPPTWALQDDTEHTEKTYVLQFFKRSLLAAVEDCHCRQFFPH